MITIPYGKTHIPYDFPYDGLLTSRVDQLSSSKSGLELVEEAMAAPIPALHFQSVCVPCFEVGLL